MLHCINNGHYVIYNSTIKIYLLNPKGSIIRFVYLVYSCTERVVIQPSNDFIYPYHQLLEMLSQYIHFSKLLTKGVCFC